MNKKYCLFFSFFLLLGVGSFAKSEGYSFIHTNLSDQIKEPTIHFVYGLNFGGYFANNATANYYNGDAANTEHSLEEALFRHYNYDRIVRDVDDIIESFEIGDIAGNMAYNPSFQVGVFGGIQLSDKFTILGEFNYTKLSVSDKFTLFTDKFTSTTEPYRLLSDIYAEEERIEVIAGFQYTIQTRGYIHPFIESGVSLTDTEILENKVNIDGININIRQPRSEYYNIRDYGIGFGFYTGVGLKMDVNDDFSLRTGASVNMSRINLGNNADILPRYTLWVRINLEGLFTGQQQIN
ncbi:MAG: hypothetical protein ACLFQS_02740 [Bacteroidales bacterium]